MDFGIFQIRVQLLTESFRNIWLLNVVIRSCNDEERTLHGETWDKCKNMKREKRASRSDK